MKIHIPTPLRSYTEKQSVIEASGATIGEMLAEIEQRYPGFRFRIIDEQDGIRRHIKIFVNGEPARDLSVPTERGDTIYIMCALSGG